MQPIGSVLLLLGLVVVHGRPDTWAMTSLHTTAAKVKLSSGGQENTVAATDEDTFCVLNQLDEVTVLLSVTSVVGGNEVFNKITAKSGTPACLEAPTDGTNITFNIYVDNKPPIFLFSVTFEDIAAMEKACRNYKVTNSGGYPDCASES